MNEKARNYFLQVALEEGRGEELGVCKQGKLVTKMTTSRRLADRKSAKFQKNVLKRGSVPESTFKKGSSYPVGPIVLGFFIFVVIGSAVLQIFRTATSGGMA